MVTITGTENFSVALLLWNLFLISAINCLSAPSFISEWVFMDSNDPSTTFRTFTHGFGTTPIKAEVQVMSPSTGFVYPGVRSAYGGNDDNSRGGVICIYNTEDVRLYGATNENTESGQAYIIYTGATSWTSQNQEQSTTGYVRVRVWHPNDLPTPDFSSSGNTLKSTGSPWPNYRSINHGLGQVPALTVMQYTAAMTVPLHGWTIEGQGSSSRRLDDADLYWGGIIYGVSDTSVRFWAGSDANYGLFSFCDGWGYDIRGSDCYYIRAYITVQMWINLGTTESYSHSELHDTSDSLSHEHSLHPLYSINLDEDILTVVAAAVDGNNNGFHFTGTGSAVVDNASGCGGVVYAYSNATSSVRFWHPTTHSSESGIIHVRRVGGETNTQLSANGNIKISLFKPSPSVINNCIGVAAEVGVNTNVTLTSGAGSVCVADYTCYVGHSLASGDLQRSYDINTAVWTGSPPECQVGATQDDSFSFTNVGTNTNVNITRSSDGILAVYECRTGYSYIQGDYVVFFDQSTGAWNGTALECQIFCDAPANGLNSYYVLSSATLLLGTIANYSCVPGNEHSSGNHIRVCYGNGFWTGSVLICAAAVTTTTTTSTSSPTTTITTLAPTASPSVTIVCFNTTTVVNITTVLEIAAEFVVNLTVDTKSTSKFIRGLTSAKDSRQSSQVIGTLGAAVCSLVIGLMVLPDCVSAIRYIYSRIE